MNPEQFERQCRAYLEDQLSPGEELDFMVQVRSGEFDEILRQQIDDLLHRGDVAEDPSPERLADILSRLRSAESHVAKVVKMTRPGGRLAWGLIPGAAVLLLICGVALLRFAGRRASDSPVRPGVAQAVPVVPPGGKKFIRLPDGSYVILNANSELDYPAHFDGPNREVSLKGEAYFDIRQVSSKPFIVHTGNIHIVVLGTAFNIRAFPDKEEVAVTVTRGKVAVGDRKKTYAVVTPNQQLVVNTARQEFTEGTVDAESVVAWKSSCLVLSDIPMEDAALLIGNRYHVKITIAGEKLKKCRINATFLDQESLDQVLKIVCGIVNATFVQQPNDQIIITGQE